MITVRSTFLRARAKRYTIVSRYTSPLVSPSLSEECVFQFLILSSSKKLLFNHNKDGFSFCKNITEFFSTTYVWFLQKKIFGKVVERGRCVRIFPTKGSKDRGEALNAEIAYLITSKREIPALSRKAWPAARNYTLRATHRLIVDPVERGHRDLTLAALPFPRGNEKGRRALSKRTSNGAMQPAQSIGRSASSVR